MSAKNQSWWRERIPASDEAIAQTLREQIPAQLRSFFFALGGTPLVLFGIQLVTGILLNFYYTPSAESAYQSVWNITYQVPFGWFVRGLHQLSATAMILTVLLHLVRVFFTKAYRRPRELNWIVGVGMGLLTLAFGFTGYALVNDQLSYWATVVGTNLVAEIPVIGNTLLVFMRGGAEVTGNTLNRFYNFHIWILPLFMLLLMIVHVLMVRLHGVAPIGDDKEKNRTYPFFPNHVLLETGIALVILIVLVNLVTLFPPTLGAAANPAETPRDVEPEWYFLFVYRWLKLVPLQLGVLLGALGLLVITVFPFISDALDHRFSKVDLPRILGAVALLVIVVFTLWELLA